MDLNELLNQWKELKQNHKNIYRLTKTEKCEFEFKRSGCNPSTYAYIQFECIPSDSLSYDSNNIWPSNVTDKEKKNLDSAIIEAIIDSLIAESIEPCLGCKIKIIKIKLAETGSSYYAVYRASCGALSLLIKNGQWIDKFLE